MIDLREFRRANHLTQDELGEYLGIKKSFISKVENGKEKLPDDKFQKLVNNDRGWDTTYLYVGTGDHIHQNGGKNNIGKITYDSENEALRRENEILRQRIEEMMKRNEEYWEVIRKYLMNK